jgi:signal transduction histidine kinase
MQEIAESNLPAKDVIRHLTHELRQPLSALESIAFYLQMTLGGKSSDVSAHIDRLQQMVDNANWVLSDVLHLLQMAPSSPVAIDMLELTEDVLSESWVSEGLTVETKLATGLPNVWADVEQCRHLLRSALQFLRRVVDEPREVALSAQVLPGSVRIELSGNAPAMDVTALFSPLEPNQLFTCRRIAESNGGQFTALQDEAGRLALCFDVPLAPLA